MNITAAFLKDDEFSCVVVQVEPKVVQDGRLIALLQGLLAKCIEIQGVPTVLAARQDEKSEPSFCGQPALVQRLQRLGWGNIPFGNCHVSMRN
jgi:hypothetical protein